MPSGSSSRLPVCVRVCIHIHVLRFYATDNLFISTPKHTYILAFKYCTSLDPIFHQCCTMTGSSVKELVFTLHKGFKGLFRTLALHFLYPQNQLPPPKHPPTPYHHLFYVVLNKASPLKMFDSSSGKCSIISDQSTTNMNTGSSNLQT